MIPGMEGTCPFCGENNRCAMVGPGSGAASCWCVDQAFPAGLVESLPEESRGVTCICQSCVIKARRRAALAKPLPAPEPGDFYTEGRLIIFKEIYHRRRGYCCGGGCRHCPFEGLERDLAFPGNMDRGGK